MASIRARIPALLAESMEKACGRRVTAEEAEASLEIPREEKFGDLSTHLALKVAKELKRPPRQLAEAAAKEFGSRLRALKLEGRISRVAVEGPGFINFYYSSEELTGVLLEIAAQGENYGRPKPPRSKKILLEFVSANPTGPLTVAHGRQAALGDALARILSFCGHQVTKEYYNNDEGVQINLLGVSTLLRYRQLANDEPAADLPENHYQGGYLIETARHLRQAKPDLLKLSEGEQLKTSSRFARDEIMEGIKKDLADFGVAFDNYYSQEALGKSGKVEKTLEELKKKGVVYENEGAVWLRTTGHGDDKDRVLVKSDKTYTYLTPDIAYHHEKFGRGFEELINILGPDHHGYIARLKASQAALGHDPERIHVLIAQLVTLYEGEKQVRMSTRAGEFVTLREILDEVGRDAGRFFFLMRKFDQHLDFDLTLAKSQTLENPVFYIQYAHARIESVKKLHAERKPASRRKDEEALVLLKDPSEASLMRILSQFEDAALAAERTLEPYRIVQYLRELAAAFHKFYADHRVVTDDEALTQARMRLILSTQTVLRSGLDLLGISAPQKM